MVVKSFVKNSDAKIVYPTLFPLILTSPTDLDVFEYSGDTPPDINLAGSSTTAIGLIFKWFTTNAKRSAISGFYDAHVNMGEESYSSSTAVTWSESRIGTQFINYTCMDQSILTSDDNDTLTSTDPQVNLLMKVTAQGIQGGKQTVTLLTTDDITPVKINVVGAVAFLDIENTPIGSVGTVSGSTSSSITTFHIGAECRVQPIKLDGSVISSGDPIEWGVDNPDSETDDELIYKMESKSTTTSVYTELWSSTNTTVIYKAVNHATENFTYFHIGNDISQDNGITKDYRLSVSYSTYVQQKVFQIEVTV